MKKVINVIEARDWVRNEKQIQLIDVRNPDDFKSGSVPGFKNIPLDDISKELPNLDGKRKALVICEDGSISQRAQQLLQACGIDTFMVRGGISDWRQVIKDDLAIR